jgi:hypothetical protein
LTGRRWFTVRLGSRGDSGILQYLRESSLLTGLMIRASTRSRSTSSLVPGCAPGDGAPPHAARPAIAALAAASRVISMVLMRSASAARGGRTVIRKSLSRHQ